MDHILIVDDKLQICRLVSELLEEYGYETRIAATSIECLNSIKKELPSMLLLDIWLHDPEMDGLQILEYLKRVHPGIPVVIMSAHGTIEIAVQAMRKGAIDYIEKPINADRLTAVVKNVMELVTLRHKVRVMQHSAIAPVQMIGQSPRFQKVKSQIERYAISNARVMFFGPPGSGRETAARYLHSLSTRRNEPFIVANFLGKSSVEIELLLFGNKSSDGMVKPGLFEFAHHGSMFLNEIIHIPIDLQSKLARIIASQQYNYIGTTEIKQFDIRFISSSSKDIESLRQAGLMHADICERLNIISVEIPSLAERMADIPELSEYLIYKMHVEQGYPLRTLTKDALDLLISAEWPGNLRQLHNVLEHTLIMNDSENPISQEEIVASIKGTSEESTTLSHGKLINLKLREAREEFERSYLITQINRFGGNISKAANFIDMERAALSRKLKTLGISTKNVSGSRIAYSEDRIE